MPEPSAKRFAFEHDWTIEYEQSPIGEAWVYKFPVSASAGEWTPTFEDESGFYRVRRGIIQVFFCLAPTRPKDWRRIVEVFKAIEPLERGGSIEATIALRDDKLCLGSRSLPAHAAVPMEGLTPDAFRRAFAALAAAEIRHKSDP
ncbi:hypothetical protein RAS1_06410 [Phycisphaerae bacterium RAS1]|nr:hypothetical protein RAS1_06410 [Phycisphaerae bacterium RAS1]